MKNKYENGRKVLVDNTSEKHELVLLSVLCHIGCRYALINAKIINVRDMFKYLISQLGKIPV